MESVISLVEVNDKLKFGQEVTKTMEPLNITYFPVTHASLGFRSPASALFKLGMLARTEF